MTRRLEQQIQRAVIDHLAWRACPGVWWCHIPNGGWRSKIEASILRGQGVKSGTPDLLIIADGKAYFLELKAPRGRISPSQHECHEALCAAGARVAVAHDIDQALARLAAWQLLRGSAPMSLRCRRRAS